MSNAMFYSQVLDKIDLIRKFYQGPLPPADQHSWSEPLRDFFYAYDVYAECEKAMQHRDKEGRVPEGGVEVLLEPVMMSFVESASR